MDPLAWPPQQPAASFSVSKRPLGAIHVLRQNAPRFSTWPSTAKILKNGFPTRKVLNRADPKIFPPLLHIGLARAYSRSGDTAKAKTACNDFLTLWKDADPDIPILKEAKAEYAKLK